MGYVIFRLRIFSVISAQWSPECGTALWGPTTFNNVDKNVSEFERKYANISLISKHLIHRRI